MGGKNPSLNKDIIVWRTSAYISGFDITFTACEELFDVN